VHGPFCSRPFLRYVIQLSSWHVAWTQRVFPLMLASQLSIRPCSRMSTRNSVTADPAWRAVQHRYLGFVSWDMQYPVTVEACDGPAACALKKPSNNNKRPKLQPLKWIRKSSLCVYPIFYPPPHIFMKRAGRLSFIFNYSLAHVLHTAYTPVYPLLRTASSQQK
jgi:hypothetical protein